MKNRNKKLKQLMTGAISGALNGLFGSGGGIAAVPLFEMSGLPPKKSHATSVALIFFLSIVSAAGYAFGGRIPWETILPIMPSGLIGAAVGALALKNVDNDILRRIFGALIIYSGGRMLLQ